MHVYGLGNEKIELVQVTAEQVTAELGEKSACVTRALRHFVPRSASTALAVRGSSHGRASINEVPVAIFRDSACGMLRMTHREAVIRFHDKISDRTRRQILRTAGFM